MEVRDSYDGTLPPADLEQISAAVRETGRAVWICVTCEAAGRSGVVLEYAGEFERELDGAAIACSVWRCPRGHEHFRPHHHGGPASERWGGTAVRTTPEEHG